MGKGLLMWMPAYIWKCYTEVFHFLNGLFELCLLACFITHHSMKFHFSALFAFLCLLFETISWSSSAQLRFERIANIRTDMSASKLLFPNILYHAITLLYYLFYFLMYSSEFSESMVCDLAHYVTLLWCRNSRRRSLCQEFCFSLPRGLQRSIFLLQQVPRLYPCYLFIAFPSLPTRRHHWHWLRCAKNLLMCLNYLCLMLGASVCSSALGWHYSCDGNSLRITALHPILLRCRERCHRAQRPL